VVAPGARATRVLAETCVFDQGGGGVRSAADHEVVFAVFHEECVTGTYSARECDVVAYLSEAREVVEASEVS
jgi:phosphoribosylformimino-5-aminoimidazole carboxamide ribonucleotide (ProFAR) isomerase